MSTAVELRLATVVAVVMVEVVAMVGAAVAMEVVAEAEGKYF